MKLYNTLTRTTEELQPQRPPAVTVYTCGPTVYDYPHIGNWFTYIREDTLIRALKLAGYTPQWVMNITDVGHLVSDADDGEDKLEKGARREGKTAWEIVEFYTGYFLEGMQRLNMLSPDHLTKATEHIPEQIALVERLETGGYTYKTSDGIYFDTARFPRYADFARLDLDEQEAGARVEVNPEKRNPTDFALWKFSPTDHKRDMEWDSPWGTGFPGWHIECSAMSMKYLGETLDIHAGGIDHIPIHHTNEIAQSEAATGKPFAKLWMHSNHITIDGEKISKSLGNGITLEDMQKQGIDLAAFRLHALESSYRSQSKFSWDSLVAAQNRLRNLQEFAALVWQPKAAAPRHDFGAVSDGIITDLTNDLNTPEVLARLSTFASTVMDSQVNGHDTAGFEKLLATIADALGVDVRTEDITSAQKQLIADRDTARAAKDWTRSDQLRAALADQGLGVRDTPLGGVWFRLHPQPTHTA